MTPLREDRTRTRIRPSTIAVISLIALLHLLGWGVLILLVIPAGIPLGGNGALVTLGVGITAYALGVRHAFDADHIAAIDNTTRRLIERGKPATTVGFWFSVGHSTVVVVLCILLTIGIAAIGATLADDSSALRTWTGVIGPSVSGVFLLVIAAVNIASLRRRHGHAGGPVLRLLGPLEKAVDRPSRMYFVGLLFGLGFDTATEIGLLTLAGAATLAAVPWWAALTLPILFAAGMSAFDTSQGAVMRRAYAWQPGRRRIGELYALAMTGLSVVAAILIAVVQLADVLVANLGVGGPLPWLASVGIDDLGFVLTGLLLTTWAVVLLMTRRPQARTIDAVGRGRGADVEARAGLWNGGRMTDQTSTVPAIESGFVELGALRMYYEVHGDRAEGTPLVLLHGGLFDIDQQFGALIPDLASSRRVIALDFQGHGRTNDIDRPFSAAAFAGDVLAVLDHLGVARADIFGFSVGGAVALDLAIEHPERVRKIIVSSTSFAASGMRGAENADAVGAMTVDMIAGTPMEGAYLAKSPHPDLEHLQGLLDKLGATYEGGFPDRTEDEVRAIEAPTLITVGDADMVSLEHAVEFLRLRGGDVNGDFDGVPASQLAVFPGTTHFFGLARTDLVRDVVIGFLDSPPA